MLRPGMSGWLTHRLGLVFLVCEASGFNKAFSARPLTIITNHTQGPQTEVESLRAVVRSQDVTESVPPGGQRDSAHAPGTPGAAPARGVLRHVAATLPSKPPWWHRHLWSLSSVQFSHSVVSDSLRPHELQHARPPCPSPSPGVHSDSRSSSQ